MDSLQRIDDTMAHRTETDRRSFGWRTVFYGFLISRRADYRRMQEGQAIFTDYHHPWLFFLATSIMVMSVLDAAFTLRLLELGAFEVNPVMRAVIGEGTLTFILTKMLLTSFGILALVFMARAMFMDRFRTGAILTVFFIFYAILVCYEFVSLMSVS